MILSIESSCDDSSLALTRIADKKLVYHIKISQDEEHSTYGGIVPEIASRLHAKRLPEILQKLKTFLNNDLSSIKAVAVTTRPGLSVTLIEGLMMAKTLCLGLQIPLICVNHLKGHIYSLCISQDSTKDSSKSKKAPPPLELPAHIKVEAKDSLGVLLVSGGHTQILQMNNFNHISIVAQSLDDSFGESFDKVAKHLNLGYPGGPQVEHYAKMCQSHQYKPYEFPIPLLHNQKLQFSFSGLKNAVRLAIQELPQPLSLQDISRICAGFQNAACEHILRKTRLFFQHFEGKYFAIVGGASANTYLRERMSELCNEFDKELYLADLEFCADNAAMIGRVGIEHYLRGEFTPLHEAQIFPKSLKGDFIESVALESMS
nr:tRNA (adenosine(37)-N6)-threonylcarbamoyltransferase complex transferase subunit TsaD [uncultured Helicobacter sp.]